MDVPLSSSSASILITCTKAFELDPPPALDSTPLLDKAAVDRRPDRKMEYSDYDSFLAFRHPGEAELTVHAPDNQSFTFKTLNLDYIQDVCPLLGFSFEERAYGKKVLSISASSIELVARFLRYIYTYNYLVVDYMGDELSCTFLMHAQLYHYAELYDLPGLMDAAYLHVNTISELGCSMPHPPLGLCDALRYLYRNVRGERKVHEAILHYCISRFNSHRLGENPQFRSLLIEEKDCQQDLFRLIRQRGYKDESSTNIIQMPLPSEPRQPTPQYDYLYDMFGPSTFSTPARTPVISGLSTPAGFTLVHRPRYLGDMPGTADSDGYSSDGSSLSDLEGFSLISRACASIESQEKSSRLPVSPRDESGPSAQATDTRGNPHDSRHVYTRAFERQETNPSANPLHPESNNLSDISDDLLFEDEDDSGWSDFDDDSWVQDAMTNRYAGSDGIYTMEDAASSTETIVAASTTPPYFGETVGESSSGDAATEDRVVRRASEEAVAGQG